MAGRSDVPEEILRTSQFLNAPQDADGLLELLVQLVQDSMPGIDHAGISISHRDGRVETKVATGDLVRQLDELQYELGEGPCLRALDDEPVVKVEHAHREQRWPRFIPRAIELGLRSQLGLRLYLNENERGGLNLYSTSTDTIDTETQHLAEFFASHAAQALGRVRQEENSGIALSSCRTIGMAIGIVMERYQLDPDRAFLYLRRVASSSETKLRSVAEDLVAETTHRQRGGE